MNELKLIRQGRLLVDVDMAIQDVVRSVNETGKAGAVTITIKIRPAAKNSTNVVISDEVKAKLPKLPTAETFLFSDRDGSLAEQDPRQGRLDFTARKANVDPETGEVSPAFN